MFDNMNDTALSPTFVAFARVCHHRVRSTPHDTREAAAAELLRLYPQLRHVATCVSEGWPLYRPTGEQVVRHQRTPRRQPELHDRSDAAVRLMARHRLPCSCDFHHAVHAEHVPEGCGTEVEADDARAA